LVFQRSHGDTHAKFAGAWSAAATSEWREQHLDGHRTVTVRTAAYRSYRLRTTAAKTNATIRQLPDIMLGPGYGVLRRRGFHLTSAALVRRDAVSATEWQVSVNVFTGAKSFQIHGAARTTHR
jgi:hypothetical protein